MHRPLSAYLWFLLCATLVLSGCAAKQASSPRSFAARGVVRAVSPGRGTLTVRHEEIVGFMPAMTMELAVRHPDQLRGLAEGDQVEFSLHVSEQESWVEDLRRVSTARRAAPSTAELLAVGTWKPGELVPDVQLTGESGAPVMLSHYAGKALAITFVFTRCPLPDFCPRMGLGFRQARELLLQLAQAPANWELLSVSFDPEFDTPEVLSRYAARYRGENREHWSFAVADSATMAVLSAGLDMRFAKESGTFVHNLRTVVLDGNRRVWRVFQGNRWRAEELADALAEAAAQPLR